MEISEHVVEDALRGRPKAISELLAQVYPHVYRLSSALAGREDVGRGVTRFVLTRSMHVMSSWEDEVDARQWFLRYTILNSRRAARHRPDPKSDLLLGDAPGELMVLVAALRKLPHQQQEAFLLHHCEKAATRVAAVAMDCSTLAFDNHLAAANESLRLAANERFDEFVKLVADRYARLAPREELILPRVKSVVRRFVWPRRVLRAIGWVIILGVIGLAVWGGPRLLKVLEF
jgi:DNA-directed RNA polymerase specialized sigma24 family protein